MTAKTAQSPGAQSGAVSAYRGQERAASVVNASVTSGRQPSTSSRLVTSATWIPSKTAVMVWWRERMGLNPSVRSRRHPR